MLRILIFFLFIYMVYPTFNVESIKKRCYLDLEHFYDVYRISPDSNEFKDVTTLDLFSNKES